VDVGERRELIADATLAVIAREGVEHATLRNVADEAELAIGSVRHYFAGQAEVVSFAMRRLAERIGARVLAVAAPALDDSTGLDVRERRTITEAVLGELLPLDETRLHESAAWVALVTASRTRPDLQPIAGEFRAGSRSLVRQVLGGMRLRGGLPTGLALLELETERLAILIDGLAMDAVLHPDQLDPDRMLGVLRRHLDSLSSAAG
jgi:AcrR family transcriptional regulator